MTTDNTHEARIVPKVWPFNGYAPGNYTCHCHRCEQQFEADREAVTCLECAVILSREAARIVPGEASAEMIEALRSERDRLLDECEEQHRALVRATAALNRARQALLRGTDPHSAVNEIDALLATPSAPPADLEAESRELLAAEEEAAGFKSYAKWLRDGTIDPSWDEAPDEPETALRAIQRALSARQIAQGVDKLVDCPVCGGSGFSGRGTGYGDVCSECGGQRQVLITRLSGGEVER